MVDLGPPPGREFDQDQDRAVKCKGHGSWGLAAHCSGKNSRYSANHLAINSALVEGRDEAIPLVLEYSVEMTFTAETIYCMM